MRRWSLALLTFALAGCGRQEPYQGCAYNEPCGSDAPLCLSNTSSTGNNARFCTLRCSAPAASAGECPGSAACVRLNSENLVCMKRCTTASECEFEGATCMVLPESMGVRVCTTRP